MAEAVLLQRPDTGTSSSRGRVRKPSFFRDPSVLIGLALIALFIGIAIMGILSDVDPLRQESLPNQAPSGEHWFGTDHLGRDVFARAAAGASVSLEVAIGSVLLGLLVAVPIGMLAGYFATTWLDESFMRIVDVILSLPLFILGLVVLGFLGAGPMHVAGVELPPITKVVALVAVAGIPMFARVARSSVLVEREEDYVDALKVVGVSRSRILFGDVFVNIVPPVLVQATTWMAVAVFAEAGLSFLGLGIQPPEPTLGNMLLESQSSLLLGRWWLAVFPGLLIFAVIVGFNLLGDGVSRAISGGSRSST